MDENLVRKIVVPAEEGSGATAADTVYYQDTRGDAWLTVADAQAANEKRKKRNQILLVAGLAVAGVVVYRAMK